MIELCIHDGGLAKTKARKLRDLVSIIGADWSAYDLAAMRHWSTDEIRHYCASLPGIGFKGASCVAAYCFGRDVCPVDTYTYRVAVRLGMIAPEASRVGEPVHLAVEAAVPEGMRLAFHLNAVAHARTRCRPVRPKCTGCPMRRFCTAPEAGRYSRLPTPS